MSLEQKLGKVFNKIEVEKILHSVSVATILALEKIVYMKNNLETESRYNIKQRMYFLYENKDKEYNKKIVENYKKEYSDKNYELYLIDIINPKVTNLKLEVKDD